MFEDVNTHIRHHCLPSPHVCFPFLSLRREFNDKLLILLDTQSLRLCLPPLTLYEKRVSDRNRLTSTCNSVIIRVRQNRAQECAEESYVIGSKWNYYDATRSLKLGDGRRETKTATAKTKKEMIHSITIRSVGGIRESYIDKRQFIHCFSSAGMRVRAWNVNSVNEWKCLENVEENAMEEMREMRPPKIGLISFFRSLNYYQ